MPRRRKNVSTDLVVVEQRLRVLGKRITLQEAALLYEALGQHVHPRTPVPRKRRKRQRKQKTA